jgi:maltooligosyltrehalose synthase
MPPATAWADTRVALPDLLRGPLHNPLTGTTIEAGADGVAAAGEVLADLPVALLTTAPPA